MSDFTKGKWRVDPIQCQYFVNIIDDEDLIALVFKHKYQNLITAAPEMYELLKAYVAKLENGENVNKYEKYEEAVLLLERIDGEEAVQE